MLFGIDLVSFGLAFIFFAFGLLVLWKIVWHTYHGHIGRVFLTAIISAVILGLIAIGLGWLVF